MQNLCRDSLGVDFPVGCSAICRGIVGRSRNSFVMSFHSFVIQSFNVIEMYISITNLITAKGLLISASTELYISIYGVTPAEKGSEVPPNWKPPHAELNNAGRDSSSRASMGDWSGKIHAWP
jgi:hypothetical protein